MKVIFLILFATALIEFMTTYLRLVSHKKSTDVQKHIGIPRIHHSYPGFVIVTLDYLYLQNEWLFILGMSLIFSDFIHHVIVEPYILKHKYDISMKHHKTAHHKLTQLSSAVALITVGVFALFTPFAPGSWLAIVGVGMLVGKNPKRTIKKITYRARKRKK